MKLLIMESSPVSCHFLPLLSTLFSHTLNLWSSLTVRDQVSHPYKTTGNIIIVYILTFKILDRRQKDKRFWREW